MTFVGNTVAGVPIAICSIVRDAAQAVDIQGGMSCPKEDGLRLVAIAVDVMALRG